MTLQDSQVQTDQRLTFLLNRSEASRIRWAKARAPQQGDSPSGMGAHKPTYTDAWVQTYIEVSNVGIQVDSAELKTMGGVDIKPKVPFNYEDISDFSDADISTVHPNDQPVSQKKRLIRKKDGTFLGKHSVKMPIKFSVKSILASKKSSKWSF